MIDHPTIVSVDWLNSNLNDPNLVIVDCRFQLNNPQFGYQEYLQGHIPGAFYLNLDEDLSSPVQKHGGRHPLPNFNLFAEKMTNLGIKQGETRVIVYDASRFAFASRLWWLLRYCGHDQVSLLDGGWQAWQINSCSISQEMPSLPKSGDFVPQLRRDWAIDIEGVKQRKDRDQVILVDSREGDRFRGEREPIDPIAGHIPGAVNSCWLDVTNEQGYLRPWEEIQKLWSDYPENHEMIFYCGSGVTACVNLLSLELIGRKSPLLYPGGWSDWCSYELV
jgi:thiosulfate/3-mercaptopyruvate sulfurtransferase